MGIWLQICKGAPLPSYTQTEPCASGVKLPGNTPIQSTLHISTCFDQAIPGFEIRTGEKAPELSLFSSPLSPSFPLPSFPSPFLPSPLLSLPLLSPLPLSSPPQNQSSIMHSRALIIGIAKIFTRFCSRCCHCLIPLALSCIGQTFTTSTYDALSVGFL